MFALTALFACGDTPDPYLELVSDEPEVLTRPEHHRSPAPAASFQAPDDLVDPNSITPGQDFVTSLAPTGSRVIDVELRAGEVFWWRVTTLSGEPVRSALLHRASDYVRLLDADVGARGAFVAYDDVHTLEVFAPEAASAFRVETWSAPLTVAPLPAIGNVESDLRDGAPRGWELTTHQHRVLEAEVLSQRVPVDSDLDATLSVWDPIARRVIAFADDINRADGVLDPALRADVEHARSYVLVVDMFARPERAPMTLHATLLDDAPESPRALDAGVTHDGVIDHAGSDTADTDYFIVWLAPGATMRIELDSMGPLEPSLEAWAARGQWVEHVDTAAACGPRSALELHHPASERAPGYYYVLVDDARNLDGEEPLGGPSYRYSISASSIDWSATPSTLPLLVSSECPQGSWSWHSVDAPAEHLLFIDADADSWIAARDTSDQLIGLPHGAVIDTHRGGTLTLGVRHGRPCGGTSELFADAIPSNWADGLPRLAEATDNHDPAHPQRLEAPARVAATTQDLTSPPRDHFVVHARAGQRILATTHTNLDAPLIDPMNPERGRQHADTIVTILSPDGTPLAQNDDTVGAPRGHFSATSARAPIDGDYTVVVSPFYAERYDFHVHGHYDLVVDVLAR